MVIEKLNGFLKLIRWFHVVLVIFPFITLYFIIDYYSRENNPASALSGFDFFLLCICTQLLIAAGCILNDIMDRHIDKINKPNTHTVGRTISLANAKRIFAVTTLLIILLSIYISYFFFAQWIFISAAVYFLSILYDLYLKKSPLIGNVLIALITAFIPLVLLFFASDCLAVLNSKEIYALIYLYALFPFLLIVPRELSLDISDMEGDKACGCRTLPILIGVKKARQTVVALILLPVVISVYWVYYYRYLLPAFLIIDILLILYLFLLKKSEKRIDYIRAGRFLWLVMFIGLTGFALCTICSPSLGSFK